MAGEPTAKKRAAKRRVAGKGKADGGSKPDQRRSVGPADAPARQRLIEATVNLLRTSGSGAVTSRAIADEAGENLGSITYYFGSKDVLLDEAMITVAEHLIRPVINAMADPEVEPSTALLVGIQMLHDVLASNRRQIPAYLHSLAAASTNPGLAKSMAALHRSLTGSLASVISSYRDDGLIADWVEPEAMAQVITAVVHGVAVSVAVDDADPDGPVGQTGVDPTAVAAQFGQLITGARNQTS